MKQYKWIYVRGKGLGISTCMTPLIQIPDPTRSTGLLKVRGTYYARYYEDGVEKRKNLGTSSVEAAKVAQKEFYAGHPILAKKSPKEKAASNPNRYIYKRPPYSVAVQGHLVGFFETEEEARGARDEYIGTL